MQLLTGKEPGAEGAPPAVDGNNSNPDSCLCKSCAPPVPGTPYTLQALESWGTDVPSEPLLSPPESNAIVHEAKEGN